MSHTEHKHLGSMVGSAFNLTGNIR